MKIKLTPFGIPDFDRLISWVSDEELLVTIAGLDFKYPLDAVQLLTYMNLTNSQAFNVVVDENNIIGHAEIIQIDEVLCKLDKVLIGDKNLRGRGIGEKLIHSLLAYSFNVMKMEEVELNVYDWNLSGIRCYEKVGFTRNLGKEQITEFGNKSWKYFNMSIDKKKWIKKSIDF